MKKLLLAAWAMIATAANLFGDVGGSGTSADPYTGITTASEISARKDDVSASDPYGAMYFMVASGVDIDTLAMPSGYVAREAQAGTGLYQLFTVNRYLNLLPAMYPAFAGKVTISGTTLTLTGDVVSSLDIPDNIGDITLNLNGHTWAGAPGANGSATTAGADGTSAVRIVRGVGLMPESGTSGYTYLYTIKSDIGNNTTKAYLIGGSGGDGNAPGNGGDAIEVVTEYADRIQISVISKQTLVKSGSSWVSVHSQIYIQGGQGGTGLAAVGTEPVTGGNGGDAIVGRIKGFSSGAHVVGGTGGTGSTGLYADNGGNGGQGGIGIRPAASQTGETTVSTLSGYVNGGTGGQGGAAEGTGTGGTGGKGGMAIENIDGTAYAVNTFMSGSLADGDGGQGGAYAEHATAGTGGEVGDATALKTSDESYRTASTAGAAGDAADPRKDAITAAFVDYPVDIVWNDTIDPADWTVVFNDDYAGTVLVPDNLGHLIIDLNGHSVTGASGAADSGADGESAFRVVAGDEDKGHGGKTESVITNSAETQSVLTGGTGGSGADVESGEAGAGGNGAAAVAVDDDADATVTIGGNIKTVGGDGGDGGDSAQEGTGGAGGTGANALADDVTTTSGEGGTEVVNGTNGHNGIGGSARGEEVRDAVLEENPNLSADDFTVTVEEDGTVVLALTGNVTSPLYIPDNLGNVKLDLAGHDIGPETPTATAPTAAVAGIVIKYSDEDGDATKLIVANTSDTVGHVYGQDGYDGTAEYPDGGAGGAGIAVESGVRSGVAGGVGPNVVIEAGDGGDGYAGAASGENVNGGNGGDGGVGIDGAVVANEGAIYGGDAGNGGAATAIGATGGNGGNGGAAVSGDVGGNAGTLSAGDGGNGGPSTAGEGGQAGAGGAAAYVVDTIAGTGVANEPGATGVAGAGNLRQTELEEAFADYPVSVVADADAPGGYKVVFTSDYNGTVTIPDNLGAVNIDLAGYSVTGTAGAESTIAQGGDGQGAFVLSAVGGGEPTTATIYSSGATSKVTGGNGGDGIPGGSGAAASDTSAGQSGSGITFKDTVTTAAGEDGFNITKKLALEEAFKDRIDAGEITIVPIPDGTKENYLIQLNEDITGPLEIPDNLGNLMLDLNGHSIIGVDGAAGSATSAAGAATSGILITASGETGNATQLYLCSETDSVVRGGNGGDGNPPSAGAAAVAVAAGVQSGTKLTYVDEAVSLIGGNGGHGLGADANGNGTAGGAGGNGSDLEVGENCGSITGGNGGTGANAANDSANGGAGGAGGYAVNADVEDNSDGTLTGGNGGAGGAAVNGNGGAGGDGSAALPTSATVSVNNNDITGGNGGNGGAADGSGSGGAGGNGGATTTVASSYGDATNTAGENGATGTQDDNRTRLEEIFPAPATVEHDGDGYRVTLAGDITGPLALPDDLGKVTLDLNGHSIVTTATDDDGNGKAGIIISEAGRAEPMGDTVTALSIVNSSATEASVVRGANGADADPANSKEAGDGGAAVEVAAGAQAGVTIAVESAGGEVSLVGGAGGSGVSDGYAGGNGGAGVDGDVSVNHGTITGGNGGNGAENANGDGGNGGAGGAGVTGDVEENLGAITGGNGGYGADSANGTGGNGGQGGAAVAGTVEENVGTLTGGENGTTGANDTDRLKELEEGLSGIVPEHGEIVWDDESGDWILSIDDDLTGPVEFPDNLGALTVKLNGHSITGAAGTAGDKQTDGGDGAAAIRFVAAEGDGAATTLTFTDGTVTGGNGGDGRVGGAGGALYESGEGVREGVSATPGAAGADGATLGNYADLVEVFGETEGVEVVWSDDDDAYIVRLTGDIDGTLEIPDNIGHVIVDTNGYDIRGANGDSAVSAITPVILVSGGSAELPTENLDNWQQVDSTSNCTATDGDVTVTFAKQGGNYFSNTGVKTGFTTAGSFTGLDSVEYATPQAELLGTLGLKTTAAELTTLLGTLMNTGNSANSDVIISGLDPSKKYVLYYLTGSDKPSKFQMYANGCTGTPTIKYVTDANTEYSEGVTGTTYGNNNNQPMWVRVTNLVPNADNQLKFFVGGATVNVLALATYEGVEGVVDGGDGAPAMLIVKGDGDGELTSVTLRNSASESGASAIAGGNGGDGVNGGDGGYGVKRAADANEHVAVKVGAGVEVIGGNGGASTGANGEAGDGGVGIGTEVLMNGGTITGGNGGDATGDGGVGGNGGAGVDGDVAINGATGVITGGNGGAGGDSADSTGGAGGAGGHAVTGLIGEKLGTTENGTAGESGDSYTSRRDELAEELAEIVPEKADIVWDDTIGDGGDWKVVLTGDIEGTLELPQDIGDVVIDINGHSIVGGTDDEGNGRPAIEIVASDDPDTSKPTKLTVVDSDPSATTGLFGGDGADASETQPTAGTGAEPVGISDDIADATGITTTIETGVTAESGKNGASPAGAAYLDPAEEVAITEFVEIEEGMYKMIAKLPLKEGIDFHSWLLASATQQKIMLEAKQDLKQEEASYVIITADMLYGTPGWDVDAQTVTIAAPVDKATYPQLFFRVVVKD